MMLIFSLCLVMFINAMSIGLVFPIFALLFTQDATPFFQPGVALSTQTFYYSLILTVPTVFVMLGAPFWGRISDRIGRRAVLIIGLLGIAFSFALSILGIVLGSLIILFASRLLAGFMDGTDSVAQAAIADLSQPEDKARYLGYGIFFSTIGFIAGPILGGILGEESITGAFHYVVPFALACTLTLINSALIYRLFPRKRVIVTVKENPLRILPMLLKGCVFSFDKRIRLYSLMLLMLHFILAVFFQLSSLVLVEQFGYTSFKVGIFTTFLAGCYALGTLLVIRARMRKTLLLKMGVLLMMLGIGAGLYFIQSDLWAWVSCVPLMLGIALIFCVLLAAISNAVRADEQGDAMGSSTAIKAFGWLLAGGVMGIGYPHVSAIFLLLATMSALSLICAFMIREPQQSNCADQSEPLSTEVLQ